MTHVWAHSHPYMCYCYSSLPRILCPWKYVLFGEYIFLFDIMCSDITRLNFDQIFLEDVSNLIHSVSMIELSIMAHIIRVYRRRGQYFLGAVPCYSGFPTHFQKIEEPDQCDLLLSFANDTPCPIICSFLYHFTLNIMHQLFIVRNSSSVHQQGTPGTL